MAAAFAAVREASDRHLGVRNIFDRALNFDPSILSGQAREVFDQVQKQVDDGEDIHEISLSEILREYLDYVEIIKLIDMLFITKSYSLLLEV